LLGVVLVMLVTSFGLWIRGTPSETQWTAIEAAIASRRWSEAEAQLRPWLRSHPGDGKAWLRLGGVLAFEGREGAAIDAFEHIVATDAAWPTARMLIGENAIKHHDLPAAERAFRDAVAHAPGAVDPRRRLVYLLTLAQRQDEARTILWDLYRMTGDPRHLATIVGLATTEGDTRDLARDLEVYFKQTPDDPWMKRAWGLMLMRVDRAAEARPHLEAAAAAFENDPVSRLALTECQITMADLGAAESTLGAPPQRPIDAARWWLSRGDLQAARGRTEEALAAWRRSIEIDLAQRAPHYRVG
jgi:tetratricopeptide (TPR) repeat protein